MDPIESIITEALTGTTDKDVAMCRVTCNTVASQAMFCKCGDILDQQTVVAVTVKTPSRRVIQGFCSKCWEQIEPAIMDAAKETGTPILVETWNGIEFSQGDVE